MDKTQDPGVNKHPYFIKSKDSSQVVGDVTLLNAINSRYDS